MSGGPADITLMEMKKFMTLLEGTTVQGYDDLMITATSLNKDRLMIARGGRGKQWKITVVETASVEGWEKP